ncbi:MAG: DUF2335 domain-containing protein [Proteobacteria bacterium]|nr:DUF2335 domain-containing protein [Cystobacterineae bacterium]MCL2259457.1 DUF2335 domain-containing protein [Cystobacterineae bacterium]MCL2314105.1 DUF2335 domain-containing protein [Pseudomonadota bacterium]
MSEQKIKASGQIQTIVAREHSGPLPAPEDMARYEAILSGAAERIFKKFEEQASHRMEVERTALNADIHAQQAQLKIVSNREKSIAKSDLLGQTLGALIALGAVVGAIFLGSVGQIGAAIALCGIPLASIIQAMRNRGAH